MTRFQLKRTPGRVRRRRRDAAARPTHTVDAEEIVTGRARYGLDATLPGALVAVLERCPYFSGGLASYDASATRAVARVRDVLVLPGPKPGDALTENLATG